MKTKSIVGLVALVGALIAVLILLKIISPWSLLGALTLLLVAALVGVVAKGGGGTSRGAVSSSSARAALVVAAVIVLAVVGYLVFRSGGHGSGGGERIPPPATATQWLPEQFVIPFDTVWHPTVTNLDTATWRPASYECVANNKPYLAATADPKTGERVVRRVGVGRPWYYYGAPGGIGHLELRALEPGTVVTIRRVM